MSMESRVPVTIGQEITIEITGCGHHGTGVGRYQGFTIFVPFVLPGEAVHAQVCHVKKTYAYAEVIRVMAPSQDREKPPCPIFGSCGGCQWQHFSYEAQLKRKHQQVVDCFERIGGMKGVTIQPVIGMKDPWMYRNKVQIPFGLTRTGKVIAGFYALNSHHIVDMEDCLIQHHPMNRVILAIKKIVQEYQIPIYNERTHKGVLRHVMIRMGVNTNEMMVVFVTHGEKLPHQDDLVERLRQEFPEIVSLIHNVNSQKTNVVLGKKNHLLWGRSYIYDTIGDLTFAISAHSFFQVNTVQTKALYDQVLRYAQLNGNEVVIDAYCGIGTITLYVAQHVKRVYGVDVVGAAIEDAKYNAKRNHMDHVHFEVGSVEKVMPRWLRQGISPDVIIMDPPRKGCDPTMLDTVMAMNARRLIYVSCNPATLARDARVLVQGGYQVVEVQPVDMFPQTEHVESVALFQQV